MAKIKIMKFSNGKFKTRGVWQNGEPWLVAKDVCKELSLSNVSKTVARLSDDEKGIFTTNTRGGEQNMLFVNESGFYHFFFSCRKVSEETKEFKKWIGHEVFPAIRRAGAAEIQKCVYVLLMSNFTVKIGHTQDFQRRMRQIEGSSGLSVVKSYHTDYMASALARKLESFCHETFADKRVLGEFFDVPFGDAITELQRLTKAA